MSPRVDYRGKRTLDMALAVPALLISIPVQLSLAIAVLARLGRPVMYRQSRPGMNGEPFDLLKFRTMVDPDPAKGLVSDADRLTPLGRRLRSTSLDELPSLWNVITGDLSIVGPRPLLPGYLPLYSMEQARRHDVRPGITGLAQVSGRNALGWEERLRMDIAYVDSLSLICDLRILARTVRVVLARKNVNAVDHATMPPFRGTTTESP